MISVKVERSPADRQGPKIADPLISSEIVARARGLAEIDRHCSNRKQINGNCAHLGHVRTGLIVSVLDSEKGEYRGMITRSARVITREGDSFTATTPLTIEIEDI